MLENNQKENLLLKIGYKEPEFIMDLGLIGKNSARFGLYKCFCGKEFKTRTSYVKNKHCKSCGCLNELRKTKHNYSRHRLYNTWNAMKNRCNNPKDKDYLKYGGRGIKVCERWLNVENFIEDMYPTFKEGLTLDRKDNNKGYSKENCRWVPKSVQSQNTRRIISTNKSGYRGVSFITSRNTYQTSICVNNKKMNLGRFKTAIDAAKAYDKYIKDNNLNHPLNFV